MNTQHRWITAIAGGVLITSLSGISAQDWPQWRGPNRDGKASSFKVPDKWPTELTPKWKTTVGTGDATPALVGDKLYIFARQGEDEIVLCLNAADGKEVWRNQYAAQAVTGAAARHPGPRGSPAVANGKVVTVGVGGVVSCLEAATGKELWRKDEFPKVVPRFFAATSPIVMDNLTIAHVGGQGNGAIIAFDLSTGEPKWKWAGEGPGYASPVLLTVEGMKQLVTLTEKSVVGMSVADGKLLWQLPFAPQGMAYNAATPIVDGPIVIFAGQGRGTKAVKVEKQAEGWAAKELWSNAQLGPQFNSPVQKDGLLFGLSDKGNFYCLNAKTGATAWTDTVKRGGNFAALLDAGSVLVALPSTSELIAFKPTDKEYAELAKIKVAETATYAHPVMAGNRIFVKDQESVALFIIE